jgi:hypothetical protein
MNRARHGGHGIDGGGSTPQQNSECRNAENMAHRQVQARFSLHGQLPDTQDSHVRQFVTFLLHLVVIMIKNEVKRAIVGVGKLRSFGLTTKLHRYLACFPGAKSLTRS